VDVAGGQVVRVETELGSAMNGPQRLSVLAGKMAVVDDLEVAFPSWSRWELERIAVDHAVEGALTCDWLTGDAPVERLVVNMLRHEFTSYDAAPTRHRHRVVREAIAERFGWLRAECDRQIQTRARQEAARARAFEAMRAERERAAAWRRKRVAQSTDAVDRFSVGMPVTAVVKGDRRDATVIKVGRSRVRIVFRIKSGAERTAMVYARDVSPL
jgi:hypothetical protein